MTKNPLRQVARVETIPAPIAGWNARDPLAAMKQTDAVTLENAIPGTGGVSLRGGYISYTTGLGASVDTLMRYNPPSGSGKLFGVAGGKVYDVTGAGAVGAAVLTGKTSSRWQSVNFGTPGGNFLVAANGADAPVIYDGASWAAMTLATTAGYAYTLTPSNLQAPCVFGQRLWFLQSNSLLAWYMPVNAKQATSTSAATAIAVYDLSSLFKLGGSLVAMADWTRDGGTGSDDFAVFITSAGEVAVYTGYDPTVATSFNLVGVFRIPPPIGSRCVLKAGADLAILTQQGVIPLSSVLPLALSQAENAAVTDRIRGAFQAAYQLAPNTFGWELAEYPRGALLIVNVPQSTGSPQQYVANTLTGAWCNFTGLAAQTWALSGDNIFFGGSDGTVYQFDVGNRDLGQPISAVIQPAFSDFGTPGQKRFLQARALYNSAVGYRPPLVIKTDYDTTRETLAQGVIPSAGLPWGSPWGSAWGPKIGPRARWQGVRGIGQNGTVLVNVASNNPFRLDHVDVTFEVGGLF